MTLTNEEKYVMEWIVYAKGDLQSAETVIKNVNPALHTICYLCQGASEKYLKALLLSKKWILKKTHSLVQLVLLLSEDYGIDCSQVKTEALRLDDYSISGRYPDYSIEYFTEKLAQQAVIDAKTIQSFVLDEINKTK